MHVLMKNKQFFNYLASYFRESKTQHPTSRVAGTLKYASAEVCCGLTGTLQQTYFWVFLPNNQDRWEVVWIHCVTFQAVFLRHQPQEHLNQWLPAHIVVLIFFTILWGIFRSSVFESFGYVTFICNGSTNHISWKVILDETCIFISVISTPLH